MGLKSQYEALPGTIPAQVIAYLRRQPAGAEVSAAELIDAIDRKINGGLHSYCEFAVKGGALQWRMDPHDRRKTLWRLGAGVSPEEVAAPAADAGPAAAAPKLPPGRRADDGTSPAGAPACAPAPASASASAPAPARAGRTKQASGPSARRVEAGGAGSQSTEAGPRWAVWSSGELVIESGAVSLMLSAADTQRLAQHLSDCTTQIWGGGA